MLLWRLQGQFYKTYTADTKATSRKTFSSLLAFFFGGLPFKIKASYQERAASPHGLGVRASGRRGTCSGGANLCRGVKPSGVGGYFFVCVLVVVVVVVVVVDT